MIQLTRLNNTPFFLNCDLIELIEERPDTIITMTNGKRILVEESSDCILEKIIEYRNRCSGLAWSGQVIAAGCEG